MLWIEPGLYVRIEQLQGPRAPMPHPLENGFNSHTAYRLMGMSNPSETADAYAILSNDRDEMWFICSRHLRIVGPVPGRHDTRIALAELAAGNSVQSPVQTCVLSAAQAG